MLPGGLDYDHERYEAVCHRIGSADAASQPEMQLPEEIANDSVLSGAIVSADARVAASVICCQADSIMIMSDLNRYAIVSDRLMRLANLR